ncbi:cytochrome P450 [Micromonospora siamensis]|uniref:Cytochrome P450 n=1 Tax=Micromonospora siamensis TaxID=299152 RepID=A0A1C5J8W1_9ACTN|nr:cytochrome P450 [Micromonospora siamensis]SCG66486.1 Cytochrome P450 [Micromonospora siamensis]
MTIDDRVREVPPGAARPSYPGPPPWAVPGLLRKLWGDRLSLLSDAADEYGDVVRFAMGPKTIYFFNHPDHAKHVLSDNSANYHKGLGLAEARHRFLGDGLLTSEGDTWRRQRRIISPAFRRERIAGFAGVVTGAGTQLTRRLADRTGDVVDLAEEMTALTMDVLGRTLFDEDLSPLRFLGPAFEDAQQQAMFEMVTLGALPLWLPLPRHLRFRAARRRIDNAVRALVRSRANGTGSDLISRLLQAGGQPTELRDQVVTMLLAGHETTASTLSWAWYLLSRHPEAAERLHAEAVEVLGDRVPGHADLANLPYTGMVIQETMRLYPPVWALPRRAVAADEIGGYPVPTGAEVMISPYTLHRHAGFWTDPDEFRPERFAAGAPPVAHRYAYVPFGAGPRVCVGSHLGLLEATLITAMVARRFRFEYAGSADPVPEAMLSLRIRGGLPLRVLPA